MRKVIRAIRTTVGAEEAVAILESTAPVSAAVERQVFYPFHWFLLRCSTSTVLGTSAVRVSCLVDGRSGLCATADRFDLEGIRASCEDILDTKLGELDGRRIAKRYAAYVVRGKRKAFVRAELEVLEAALIYKPFWVVGCKEGSTPPFRMLVDGVTGGFYPLPTRSLPPTVSRARTVRIV